MIKAGLLPGTYARQLSMISAAGELVGYAGSISLNALRIATTLEREVALIAELQRRRKVRGCEDVCACVWGVPWRVFVSVGVE